MSIAAKDLSHVDEHATEIAADVEAVYALVFRLDGPDETHTRLRAETRAEFPGIKGSLYRTLVIRSRGHVLVTRRLLNAVKQRPEHISSER